METPSDRSAKPNPAEAVVHITSAREMLKAMQGKIGEHPEVGAIITKLEMALNALAIQTGGLL